MDHPPPHSFSRSPVEEVFCRCTCRPGALSFTLAVPAPYPGWPVIRERIREMVTGAGDISLVTGCMLRYTDLLPAGEGKTLPGTEDIAQLLSGIYNCSTTPEEVILIGTRIPGTAGSVCSIPDRPGKPGWTLAFTVHTEGPARFISGDGIVEWFDGARAEIHRLFDLIVPEEILQALR